MMAAATAVRFFITRLRSLHYPSGMSDTSAGQGLSSRPVCSGRRPATTSFPNLSAACPGAVLREIGYHGELSGPPVLNGSANIPGHGNFH